MARQTITMLTDDLDGGAADETIAFGFDGVLYEIDLSQANAKTFRDFMEKYTSGGQRKGRLSPTGAYIPGASTAGHGVRKHGTGAEHPNFAANKELNQRIRAWADTNGYHLADRGRIPQHIVDAYHKGVPARSNLDQDALPTLGLVEDPAPETDAEATRRVITGHAKTTTATKTAAPKTTRTRRTA